MLVKLVYGVVGFLLLLLGLFGLIMPLIPGLVFFFLAVICFAKVFPELQVWLDTNSTFRAVESKMRFWWQRCTAVLSVYRKRLVSSGIRLTQGTWLKVIPVMAGFIGRWLQSKWGRTPY